ncbi:MAG: hypothetical protein E7244_27425 [Enterocloster citroniae]|nr:hypothetical protein [Enterocloster citroniae]
MRRVPLLKGVQGTEGPVPEKVPRPDRGAPGFGPSWPEALTVGRELARDERKGIRRLVTGWCASYDGAKGLCLPLDCPCYMLGKVWTGAYCRYFRESVLPLDPVLESSLCGEGPSPDARLCAVCGSPFLPEGRQAYCSPACKDEGNRRKSRERMRKKRSKSGQGRYDLGLAKARDFKGF